jgi:TolB-like protein/cytochrome c-type biogenesis protein CcmH/NrfG
MPVAEGESLRDRLTRDRTLSVPDAVRLTSEVADALDYAHRRDVVHRDIKPENILLHAGHALITDFGIGKALSTAATGATLTQLGLVVGTPAYMSPEQAGGEPELDGRTDLYSLGCVLYEMLAGEPPFTGGTVQAVIAKRFKETPPDLTAAQPSVPRPVGDITRKLMAMEPDQRFATGAQVVEALAKSVTPSTGTAAYQRTAGESGSRLPWIAVLSFQCRDPGLEEFAAGLAEDITTGLSRFPHLQVISHQSAAQLPAGTDARKAGLALGARYLVEGSLRKSGTTIRLSAQLVDAATGTQLWAEAFDRDLAGTGVFAVQDELTDRIVATVADPFGILVRVMAKPLAERPVEELTVGELCIRAYAYSHVLGPTEHGRLRGGFERALEEEPNHAEGWAALATLYWSEKMHMLNPLPNSLERALAAAQRAVQVDGTSQPAWEALAETQYFLGDLAAFRQSAARVLALNPRNTSAGAIMAMLTAFGGEWDRGFELVNRMMALNPLHAGWFYFVPFHYHYRKGEYSRALDAVKRMNMPEMLWSYRCTASVCVELERWEEARAAVLEMRRRFPGIEQMVDIGAGQKNWVHDDELMERQTRAWARAVAAVDGLAGPPKDGAAQAQSIAVLPFANMSPDGEEEYFADGITEEIINSLSQLPGLNVAARTSCFAFKGKNEDLRLVGEKLGVRHVLEGSVRKAQSRVRITAQLIKVADGYHLWSERFDRELVDIFALQDEIANAIAGKLSLALLPASQSRTKVRNVEAYELLLKGRALLWLRGASILEALPILTRAAELDPDLVDAHALLADALRLKWLYGMAPARETVPLARAAIDRALTLDPENPQALATLANIIAVHDQDRVQAVATSDRALRRDPRSVQALCEKAIWLSLRTDTTPELREESLRAVRTARTIDPLSSWASALEAFVLLSAQRNREAVEASRQAIALDPGAFTGRWALVWALSATGADEEALAVARETLPMSGRNPRILTEIAAIHARRGEAAAVREVLTELKHRVESGYIESCVLGCVMASAGNLEEARTRVIKGIADHEPYFQFSQSPAWAAFRSDPQGRAILEKVGF